MARKSVVQRNKKRIALSGTKKVERGRLRTAVKDTSLSMSDRFAAQIKLSKMSRDSSCIRVRNRCLITGRSRGVYRRFGLSRILLRSLCSFGQVPGMTKSSW